jgi:hypothetical protein
MSLLTDFRDYLVAQGVITSPWVPKLGMMPPEPDEVVAFFAAGGTPTPTKRLGLDTPVLNIHVRGSLERYDQTLTLATAIHNALHEARGLIGATFYPWVLSNHPPLSLGYDPDDGKRRPEFSMNFSTAREVA